MSTKRLMVVLVSCLTLVAAPMLGCGTDDPSENNENNESNENNENNQNNENNENNENNQNNDNDAGNNNEDDGGGDDDGGENNDLDPSDCQVDEEFTGQVYETDAEVVPYDDADGLSDAGLQAVYDEVPTEIPEEEDSASAELDEPLEVDGALVVATSGADDEVLFLVDENAALMAWDAFDEAPEDTVQPGDMVSMSVEEVENYGGDPQIASMTDFQVDSSDNDVPYHPMTNEEFDMDSWGEMVRVGGMLTEEIGECGGDNICYELTHGDDERTIVFRSTSEFLEEGVCVTYFGPQGSFPGPLGEDPDPQLNSRNWDWAQDDAE